MQDLFCEGQIQNAVESIGMWLFCSIITLVLYYFCFGNKWVLDPIFTEFSTPCAPCWQFKNIEV